MKEPVVDKPITPRFSCPDCYFPLQPISLIGCAPGPNGGLAYAAEEAQPGRSLKRFPITGKVRARMWPYCGRIELHAEPSS
jgi:hypothetical protein